MPRTWTTILLFVLLLCPALPAGALESATVSSPRATVSLVSDTDAIAPNTPFRAGLHFRLAPGWHTYWRNPGDAGAPPDMELTLPPASTAGPIVWPTPQRVAEGPLMTYAYTGDLLLAFPVTPGQLAGATAVRAHAQWLVCKDICVPEEADFRLDLPPGTPAPSAQAPLFAALDRQVPRPSPWQAVVGGDGTLWVQGPELTTSTVVDAWFIPDTPGVIRDSAAQPLTVWQGGFTLALKSGKAFRPAEGLSGILTVRDRSGLETDVVLRAAPGEVPPPPPAMRLQRMLGLAFLGGLILNLMPCVFPVLAMKVVGLAGAASGRARLHAAAYTVGVLVAFSVVGAALLVARAAGAAAGWGFQFQSPTFVASMAWLLFAVGLNLSGVFQIGTGLAGAGQGLTRHAGQMGSFFTGLLAVVVATPCTAPFMGVAIAAGLAAPPAVTMLVFVVMGLGMAAPYALLARHTCAWACGAQARAMDGDPAARAGVSDVCGERLAGLGDQSGGWAGRRAGYLCRPRAAGICRLGAGDNPGSRRPEPPRWAVRGGGGGAGGTRGTEWDFHRPGLSPAWSRPRRNRSAPRAWAHCGRKAVRSSST